MLKKLFKNVGWDLKVIAAGALQCSLRVQETLSNFVETMRELLLYFVLLQENFSTQRRPQLLPHLAQV